jgi:hypothetical protein
VTREQVVESYIEAYRFHGPKSIFKIDQIAQRRHVPVRVLTHLLPHIPKLTVRFSSMISQRVSLFFFFFFVISFPHILSSLSSLQNHDIIALLNVWFIAASDNFCAHLTDYTRALCSHVSIDRKQVFPDEEIDDSLFLDHWRRITFIEG